MQTVVIVGKYFPPFRGGIETITKQCADALLTRYNVIVLCYNTRNKTEIEVHKNLKVVRCATPFVISRQPISLSMALKIMTSKADLIHFHAPNFWAAALLTLLKRHTPLVITHHADVAGRKAIRSVVMPFYRALLRRTTSVVVSSIKNVRHSTDLRCDSRKIVEIPFGLNSDMYPRVKASPHLEDGRGKPALRFGFCGRLVWYKGLDVFLKASKSVDNVALSIIGEGPLRSEMEELAKKLDISEKVTFHGDVSDADKVRLMGQMDVFVLPSTHVTETFGIAQLEAQMLGLPCIGPNLPSGASDVVDHERTGLLVEPGSVSSLIGAMRRMVNHTEFRVACGERARSRAMRLFSERAFSEKYGRLIDAAIGGQLSGHAVVPTAAVIRQHAGG